MWATILGSVLGPITTLIDNWQKRSNAKLESELRISEAVTNSKVKLLEDKQAGDIAWENTALQNAGWKDEYLTVVFSIPLILCFIPWGVEYVYAGFAALEKTPDWYQWTIGVIVAASFGYKKIADFMQLKKGV